MSQVKLAAVKELVREKKYIEARALLLTMPDDPIAQRWLSQLDERIRQSGSIQPSQPAPQRNYTVIPPAPPTIRRSEDYEFEPTPLAPVENTGMAGCFRIGWGILTLLALGWIAYGVIASLGATGSQLNTAEAQASAGYQAGTLIGGGIGLSIFLCTGLPLLLVFGILYWRNGVAIRETKKHNQMVDAMRRQR